MRQTKTNTYIHLLTPHHKSLWCLVPGPCPTRLLFPGVPQALPSFGVTGVNAFLLMLARGNDAMGARRNGAMGAWYTKPCRTHGVPQWLGWGRASMDMDMDSPVPRNEKCWEPFGSRQSLSSEKDLCIETLDLRAVCGSQELCLSSD